MPIKRDNDKLNHMRATNEEVIRAYQETGSIWAAGLRLGCAGQTVHKRLKAMGHEVSGSGRAWTSEEEAELRRLIEDEQVPLLEVANRLDRSYSGVALRASRLSIKTTRTRSRKPKRGVGLDKASMVGHMKALEASDLRLTQYVRREGMQIGPFVRAMQNHLPERWTAYAQSIGLEPKKCLYCLTEYYPTNGKQMYCTQQCGTRRKTDDEYFGGRRRETVGIDLGQCQLCGEKPKVGLSSHHMFGKGNDDDNQHLIALCRGCHDVVTRVAARKWATSVGKLESLLMLVTLRADGARYMREGLERMPSVSVEIEDMEVPIEDEV